MRTIILLSVLLLLPYLSHSQNIVLNITGKVSVNGQPVKKGDNLKDNLKVVFEDPNSELKILSQVGVCVIKHKNYEQKKSSELSDLIKSCIRKNSVATLDTRAWKINPDKSKQIELIDILCKTLNVTSANVNELFSSYITPYCVLEFETPYWQDIADFMQTKYGFNPPRFTGEMDMTQEQYQRIPLVPKVRSLAPLPPAASLKKYAPIPGNQGQYGTCTGWASAYAARTISWAIRNNLTDVQDITNQAFSPSFIYAQIKNNNDINCQDGAVTSRTVEVLKDVGAVFLTDLPYQCNPNISPFIQEAKTYAIKDYQRLTTYAGIRSADDFNNIKKALADKKPVLVSIKCYQSFGGKVWNGRLDDYMGGHAMCIIGYDDNFDNSDGTFGAVELMNSWGTTWGDGGFIRVKYQDLPKILNYAVSMYDEARPMPPPEPPKPLPVPPPAPDPMKRMEGSFSLILSDGTSMQLEGDEAAFRGLRLTSAEKMTYNILDSYPAGTMFRINFTSSQPAYIYVISTDSKRSPLAQLFPDPERNISALLDFNSEVSVSIPDETQYIQMDETQGEDYLCVIYSKEELNMDTINNSLQNNPGESFVRIVKKALADKIVEANEVKFEKNKISFKAASINHTAVPIFVKIKHR
ncbi:C1 family peptidase [Dysgonomonas sp. 521]|uniref:C1 family peptidase n=1 Tax=Dysgonomonas sp. 521 TaxID=2302932 RepID=UPI0013CF78DE